MAKHQAIGSVSQTLVGLLESALPPEFVATQVKLHTASDFTKTPTSLLLSLYLYRVAINPSGRNRPYKTRADGKRYRAPLPLDLYYMLTAWSNSSAKDQQHLLAWAARLLDDFPVIPAGVLNHYAQTDVFDPEENVELTAEHLSQEQMVSIWEVNKTNMQPSLTYAARCVGIDSNLEFIEGEPVQTRVFELREMIGAK
jgi:Pvc16 N-terminal domain